MFKPRRNRKWLRRFFYGGIDMKFKNVLLASDFDGTLANGEGKITKEVVSAIKYFMSEGGRFTVCTGRIYQGFHLYSDDYINAPVLLGNGAMAYDYKSENIVFNDAIGEEGVPVVREVISRFPSVAVEMYNFNKVCSINAGEDSIRHFTSQGIDFTPYSDPSEALLPWTKVMIYAHGCSLDVQRLLDGHREINYLKTTGDYIELLKKGVDKGSGLMKLGKMLGCKPCDIYSAGDGYNDVDMLEAAAKGFVPQNGSSEALSVADYVTRSNDDGCIAHAVEILDSIY